MKTLFNYLLCLYRALAGLSRGRKVSVCRLQTAYVVIYRLYVMYASVVVLVGQRRKECRMETRQNSTSCIDNAQQPSSSGRQTHQSGILRSRSQYTTGPPPNTPGVNLKNDTPLSTYIITKHPIQPHLIITSRRPHARLRPKQINQPKPRRITASPTTQLSPLTVQPTELTKIRPSGGRASQTIGDNKVQRQGRTAIMPQDMPPVGGYGDVQYKVGQGAVLSMFHVFFSFAMGVCSTGRNTLRLTGGIGK